MVDQQKKQRDPTFLEFHIFLHFIMHAMAKSAYALRGWAYIFLFCALFLCKAEAAAPKTEDLDLPTDPITGEISLDSGLHRFMFVTIRRSKTDQQRHGGKSLSYYFIPFADTCILIS